MRAGNYRTLKDSYNDKYENIFPDLTLSKSLFSERFGSGEIQTNLMYIIMTRTKQKKLLIIMLIGK